MGDKQKTVDKAGEGREFLEKVPEKKHIKLSSVSNKTTEKKKGKLEL